MRRVAMRLPWVKSAGCHKVCIDRHVVRDGDAMSFVRWPAEDFARAEVRREGEDWHMRCVCGRGVPIDSRHDTIKGAKDGAELLIQAHILMMHNRLVEGRHAA